MSTDTDFMLKCYVLVSHFDYNEYTYVPSKTSLHRDFIVATAVLKDKVHPWTGHEGPEGEQRYSPTLSLTSALDWGWVVNATPRPLYPWERACTHCIGGWMGPRAGLDRCGKSRPPAGFDPRTVQPVASRYTDWAVPAHSTKDMGLKNVSFSLTL